MEPLLRTLGTVLAAVLALAIAAMTLGAWLRWGMRCDEGCYLRSAEPGQRWTRYSDSWQWHAQFALALVAVIAVGVALMTIRARPLTGVAMATIAVAFAAGWVAWYLATPLRR